MPDKLQGNGVISGIAMGRVMRLGKGLDVYLSRYEPDYIVVEKKKIDEAVDAVVAILDKNIASLRERNMTEQAEILQAHSLLAQDPMFTSAMTEKVNDLGSAPDSVLAAAQEMADVFAQMEDPYLRERAVDIRDIGKRIAKYLLGVKDPEMGDEPVILCGREIEPSVIANIPAEKIAGVILGQGSTTCHAVIIAKARSIPTVVGLGPMIEFIDDGEPAILDGASGTVIVSPSEEQQEEYQQRLDRQRRQADYYNKLADMPAVTTDGVELKLAANIGQAADLQTAVKYNPAGVGLFRSEFLFMGRKNIPTEDEQFDAYKKAVEACGDDLCVIRTMDIGGDKPLEYLNIPQEDNPFLGWRAIRISLMRKDLFLPQLKAVLRAAAFGKMGVMLPMVVSVDEVRQTKEILDEARKILESEGKAYGEILLGIMVETPAAAMLTPMLAKHVDFFSIGTNDLIQYTLAVDRVNRNVSYLYDPFHPSVLRLIKLTIESAKSNGIVSSMCGEMASDPYAAVILLAMGIDKLSMSAPSIPKVKEIIRSISFKDAEKILNKVMEMDEGSKIRSYIHKAVDEIMLAKHYDSQIKQDES